MSRADDEFFIGWEPKAPPALGGRLRRLAAILLLLGAGIAAALAASHSKAADSTFEFGVVRSFEGTFRHAPYPMLLVDRPGGGRSTWLVTIFGKHGAESETAAYDGRRVKLDGSLIHRGGRTMVEVQPRTIEDLGTSEASLEVSDLGEATLRGEIVDSKCYLGVMKPGNLKTHRACAVRCISGGVPPVLLVRGGTGAALRPARRAGRRAHRPRAPGSGRRAGGDDRIPLALGRLRDPEGRPRL